MKFKIIIKSIPNEYDGKILVSGDDHYYIYHRENGKYKVYKLHEDGDLKLTGQDLEHFRIKEYVSVGWWSIEDKNYEIQTEG